MPAYWRPWSAPPEPGAGAGDGAALRGRARPWEVFHVEGDSAKGREGLASSSPGRARAPSVLSGFRNLAPSPAIPYTSPERRSAGHPLQRSSTLSTWPIDRRSPWRSAMTESSVPVLDFGGYKVRRSRLGRQTILRVHGGLGTHAPHGAGAAGALGPGGRGAGPGRARADLAGHGAGARAGAEEARRGAQELFLCNPPSRLVDVLTLGGMVEMYPVAGVASPGLLQPAGSAAAQQHAAGAPGPGRKRPAWRWRLRALDPAHRADRPGAGLGRAVRPEDPAALGADPARLPLRLRLPPSEVVGGDFFDFLPLADGTLGISIGDVSGKGSGGGDPDVPGEEGDLPPGPGSSRPAAGEGPPAPPWEVICRANQDLRRTWTAHFITSIYGVLEPRAGICGSSGPGTRGRSLRPRAGPGSRGRGLGGDRPWGSSDERFRARRRKDSVELRPGDVVLLCTDGLVEARSPRGQVWSRERLPRCPAADPGRRHPGGDPLRSLLRGRTPLLRRGAAGRHDGAPHS